jgi:hypothetical protein
MKARATTKSFALALSLVLAASVLAQESSTFEVFDKAESSSPWTQSPSAFRGLAFGASEKDMAAAFGPVKCRDESYDGARYRECRAIKNEARFIVNGVTVEDFYQFSDGKLVAVRFYPQTSMGAILATPSYNDFLAAFSDKYGPPTSTWKMRNKGVRSARYNMLGVPLGPYVPYEFISRSSEWRNASMLITLHGDGTDRFNFALIQTADWEQRKKDASKKPTTAF